MWTQTGKNSEVSEIKSFPASALGLEFQCTLFKHHLEEIYLRLIPKLTHCQYYCKRMTSFVMSQENKQ